MRDKFALKVEQGRLKSGPYASPAGAHWGAFDVMGPTGMQLLIIASDGEDDEVSKGWQHVSVSGRRMPNWEEMCYVKELFWGDDEVVIQFHPTKDAYVNFHPNCLHLWARKDGAIPLPPTMLVGPRNDKELKEQLKEIL